MTPFQEEDRWDPKVIFKWLVQIGLVVSFVYLSYSAYIIYQEPPSDVEPEKLAIDKAQILVSLSVVVFALVLILIQRAVDYYRGDS
jgi:hypothetical protein